MFKLFKKNQKNVDKKPVNKQYTDKELSQALEEDGIKVTEQDIQKARENESGTLYKIGNIYYKKKKYKKAYEWFHKAALQGHAKSQAQVGQMYQKGEGVSFDFKQAMDWYMKAASTGNATGQYNIGELYYRGLGVSQDYKKAMDWYLKAANNGDTRAMNKIGRMYQYGHGVTKNIPSAIEWYTKAAKQGNGNAQDNLGWIYQNEGGYTDLQKAVNWFQKAADNGYDRAKNIVNELNKYGYYAKDEEKQANTQSDNETIQSNDINNSQTQPSTTTSTNDNSIENRMENLEKMFQSKINIMEGSNYALQKELAALKQKELERDEENRLLKERLARMEAGRQGDANNDLNYDSSDNGEDNYNDINYDSECSDGEEEEDKKDDKNTKQEKPVPPIWTEEYADPNYSSSDNEDPRNDIYYD